MSPMLQSGQGQPIQKHPKLNRYLLSMYQKQCQALEIQLWTRQVRAYYLQVPSHTQSVELVWELLGSIHRPEVHCSTLHQCIAALVCPPNGIWTGIRMATTLSLSTFWTRQTAGLVLYLNVSYCHRTHPSTPDPKGMLELFQDYRAVMK